MRSAGFAALAMLLGLTASPGRASQQSPELPERFTAVAANLNGGRPLARTVQIEVNRLSTDGQRERLLTSLSQKGQDALLETLRKQPAVGTIRTPDSLAYTLRYARSEPWGDGGQRIVLATDRPIAFWEASRLTRSLDYPFTVIEMRVDARGHGEGKMSVATKIVQSGSEIVLENYEASPVLLTSVTRGR
jgi:hypothetical protein